MPAGDMDALPLWLKREKIDAHGLAEELPRRFLARDADPNRRLRDFRELSRQADSADGYGGFVSGESPVEMSDPFGDARVLSFAAKLDGCPWRTHKFVMRRALKDRLPADITSRPKTSGISQLSDFFLTSESDWVDGFVRDAGLVGMDRLGRAASQPHMGLRRKPGPPSRQNSFSCPVAETIPMSVALLSGESRDLAGSRSAPREHAARALFTSGALNALGCWLQGEDGRGGPWFLLAGSLGMGGAPSLPRTLVARADRSALADGRRQSAPSRCCSRLGHATP